MQIYLNGDLQYYFQHTWYKAKPAKARAIRYQIELQHLAYPYMLRIYECEVGKIQINHPLRNLNFLSIALESTSYIA